MVGPKLLVLCERDVGLFSLFCQVVGNIPRAEAEQRIPIVYFGHRCCYWTPAGYAGKDSVWEYYFEPLNADYPVSNLTQDVRQWIDDHFPLQFTPGIAFDERIFVSNNYGDHPDLNGTARPIPYREKDPSRELREAAAKVIATYIRPRSYILDKVDAFWRKHCEGRHVIGVHIRGTDSVSSEEARGFRQGLYDLGWYQVQIDTLLQSQPDAALFVATDDESSLAAMRDAFGHRVISYESIRHAAGDPAGQGPTGMLMPSYISGNRDTAARNGEEAVIEYLLLSRCNHFVHNNSSMARSVLITAPGLSDTSFLESRRADETNRLIERVKRSKSFRRGQPYKERPNTAVIVQSFNQAKNVPTLIQRLRLTGVDEIIVCEDGSVDESRSLWMNNLINRNDFAILSNDLHEIRTYGRAISFTNAELVCLLQDDDIPPESGDWFVQAVELFERYPNLAFLGGWCGFDDWFAIGWNSPFHNTEGWVAYNDPETGTPFMFVENVNIGPYFLRRSAFLALGGFDTEYSLPGEPGICFESEICYRAWNNGYQVALVPIPFDRSQFTGGTFLWDRPTRMANIAKNKERIKQTYGSVHEDIRTRVRLANSALTPRSRFGGSIIG